MADFIPKKYTIERNSDSLIISRRWMSTKYLLTFIAGLAWAVTVPFLLISEPGFWVYFICFHIWVSLGAFYYSLAGLINVTRIKVEPNRLSVEHKPLPFWGVNTVFKTEDIAQIYAKRKIHNNRKAVSFTYEVHIKNIYGKQKTLLTGLETPMQAQYLEQELEHFLKIQDKPVFSELSQAQDIDKLIWEAVAEENNLILTDSKITEAIQITGIYQGAKLHLTPFRAEDNAYHIRLTVSTQSVQSQRKAPAIEEFTEVVNELHEHINKKIQGIVTGDAKQIQYEQFQIVNHKPTLQFLFNSLTTILNAYPELEHLGGKAILALQPVITDKNHCLQPLLKQWAEKIAYKTATLKPNLDHLTCQQCLASCTKHELELGWAFDTITYYGCRTCHHSNNFYPTDTVVAVLDSQMIDTVDYKNNILRVSWFTRRTDFDFSAVEIVNATDEEIERFAIQIGNETDGSRQARYKTMLCLVSAQAKVSPNSLKVLQHFFGQVTVENSKG